ncbi:MAG: DUF3987 domain-containing protein [Phycisphaerales bacterium]|nr:DUF3987 domain-containing protein [Phycisphaerales bacterium]
MSSASAAVSLFGTTQPGLISKLLRADDFASGLAARLLMVKPPITSLRWNDKDIPEKVTIAWKNHIREILQLEHDKDDDGEPRPQLVRFTPDATARYGEFYNQMSDRWADATNDDIQAAIAKLRGGAARLALVIHMSRACFGEVDPDMVDITSLESGIALAEYFHAQALEVYQLFEGTEDERRRQALLDLIKRKGGSISVRELMRSGRTYANSADDAERALRDLVTHGYGTINESISEDGGRQQIIFTLYVDVDKPPENCGENAVCQSAPPSTGSALIMDKQVIDPTG